MQMLAASTKTEMLLRACAEHPASVIVAERSMWSDSLFAADLSESDRALWERLLLCYATATNLLQRDSVIQFYLRVSPAICARRAHARGRAAESALSENFLLALHERHERAFGSLPECCVFDAGAAADGVLASVLAALSRLAYSPSR